MGYKVEMQFEYGATDYYLDEVFATREEAEEAALDEMSNWHAGGDMLADMGEGFVESSAISYEIEEL